tara:strand:- start:2225 stop:2524 length:300 start_codon:yes stop_codon:yes gene_type:complete
MMTRNIHCPVEMQEDAVYGEYANAFRILVDGPDAILDFCVYSEETNKARVVSRLRVAKDFIGVIMARLGQDVKASISENAVVGSSESVLFMMPTVEGDN